MILMIVAFFGFPIKENRTKSALDYALIGHFNQLMALKVTIL